MRSAPHSLRARLVTAALLLPFVLFVALAFALPMLRLIELSLSSPEGAFASYIEIASSSVYRAVFANTVVLALSVAALTTLLAYPTAYMVSELRGWKRSLALWCVLFPLWISVLVRTFSWILLLERNGPVNRLLLASGLVDTPVSLLFNSAGVHIGMVQVLLPYALLPILTSMRTFDGRLLLASDALGARPITTFWRVYLPLTLPGVMAGFTLVFLLGLGFYITPAILGGPGNMTIAMLIDQFVTERLVWPLAAAASVWLLAVIVLLMAVASRFVGLVNVVAAR
ncbi:binding-protein-dependent transport systems inner membrane component [Methylobacterium sp. 4-46]|uniref:ABC transporter permease n=1 Tax=unclassified Methylobacterium TaxID=2615210 RepID=UPI000152D708|nr:MULTISPECIES: ABC transporter permease [Methylobacterium]ACA18238.1 binding-protein-dependent transport systems inner membrane component [Methylobacterium sp. 4-46]WFT77534.1 ABC transporter permease [Methylobacterium nodulans]